MADSAGINVVGIASDRQVVEQAVDVVGRGGGDDAGH
jgi:hypothetical protein